jgi:hypothetical protein
MTLTGMHKKTNSFEWWLLTLVLLLAPTGFAWAQGTYALPSARSVKWEGNTGVLNDIPVRTTIYRTLGPSGRDDTSALQSAIDNCPPGQVVKLKGGRFKVSNSLKMRSAVTLRGSGMGLTILQGASGMAGSQFVSFPGGGYSHTINLAGGLSKGSSTITTSMAHGWSAGDLILIDQLNNSSADPPVDSVNGNNGACTWCGRVRGTRSLGQTARIVSVPTPTTATLEIPLYWNYDAALIPQGTKISGVITDAGIENLTVDNSQSGSGAQTQNGTILMQSTANCWLSRVEIIGSHRQSVMLYRGYRNTIRGCRFHEGVPALPANGAQYDTSRAYGIYLTTSSAGLIENNEFYHLTMSVALIGPASGNVISYNYFHGGYNSVINWQQEAIVCHGAHPMMNLYEGNYTVGLAIAGDYVHGTSSHNTLFRNRITNSGLSSAIWAVNLYRGSWYYNVVGNVIGTSTDTTYEIENVNLSPKARAIFKLGYVNGGDTDPAGNDGQVKATLLRHANWNSVSGLVWTGRDGEVLPASLYLSARPSWLGPALKWPPIGPDLVPMYPPLPARGAMPWGSPKSTARQTSGSAIK